MKPLLLPDHSQFASPEATFETAASLEQPLSLPQDCLPLLRGTRVAVVGAGLAGLAAARRLSMHGVSVRLYEARRQVGGRVLSNHTFSAGRITEEGAELIGSFHTRWLTLARSYGLSMISRMDDRLYARAGLDVNLKLDAPVPPSAIRKLGGDMGTVLAQIARDASQITDPTRPWDNPTLKAYDAMSVASALEKIYHVPRGGTLWKGLQFLLVNNEVAPLEAMNFLGLLCKVRGGQGRTLDGQSLQTGYWDELEIFRCADGCQKLADKMKTEIETKYRAEVKLGRAVTQIKLSGSGVEVLSRVVVKGDGTLGGPTDSYTCRFVILATPPSVWDGVAVTVNGEKANPGDAIGLLGMGPAVKFFSDLKERVWVTSHLAPYGGSSKIGQVWEGTDNQTRVARTVAKQGIVLSVFAGPTVTDSGRTRVPTAHECRDGLADLYPGYLTSLNKTLFSNWPEIPFIRTGYAAPGLGQIFTIAKRLTEPYHRRLFFAGEHTQMAFFGYMEGALRSGERAANDVVLHSCGQEAGPPPRRPDSRSRIA